MSQQTPTKKVSYFNHFPHVFIKPYGGQVRVNENTEFMGKLNPKNCEWLIRPHIAMSEFAQAIQENLQIVNESQLLNEEFKTSIQNKLTPISESLKHLNTNDKTTTPNPDDVYRIMSLAVDGDEEFDQQLAELMYASSAAYVTAVQLRALRSVMTYSEAYANKLTSDDPQCQAFKSQKNLQALQQMLTSTCCSNPPPLVGSVRRNLSQQLYNPSAQQAIPPPGSNSAGLQPPSMPSTSGTTLVVPPPNSTSTATISTPPTVPNVPPQGLMEMLLSMQQQIQELTREKQGGHTNITQEVRNEEQVPESNVSDVPQEEEEVVQRPKNKKRKKKDK